MRFSLIPIALAVMLAACSSTPASSSAVDPADADFTITSAELSFDKSTLTVPAGEAFTLALVNESSMPHNVAIYTDDSASEDIYIGAVITNDTVVYEIPALDPGEYFFRCDVHPVDMVGTLIVEG